MPARILAVGAGALRNNRDAALSRVLIRIPNDRLVWPARSAFDCGHWRGRDTIGQRAAQPSPTISPEEPMTPTPAGRSSDSDLSRQLASLGTGSAQDRLGFRQVM